MADFLMPALGADMETGKVVQWLVEPGARVKPGDVVAVVETHKGAIDVEIFLDGVIEDLAPLDVELPVGAVLAHVGDAASESARVSAAAHPTPAPLAPAPTAPSAPQRTGSKISPAAKQRARALGIDVAPLRGSGVEGAITLADVERAAGAAAAAPPAPTRGIDPAPMRNAIATAMARSKREIPHYYLSETIPMRRALDWLHERNEALPVTERLLSAVLLIKAVALALSAAPELNGFFVDGEPRVSDAIHLGFAVSLRGGAGLLVPVLRDVDRLGVAEIMAGLRDRVSRARAGRLRSSELSDATCTVTSLGDQGVDKVFGIIHPPQVALVGFGAVREQPWARDGAIAVRPVLVATLSADHRASDGQRGARFLARVRALLERPEEL
jgi:pyruvate dehydrogenase E2 component (dihydrolipoamide acetyltransferase)